MEFIRFQLEQMVEVLLNGKVVDLVMVTDTSHDDKLIYVKSVRREAELGEEYFFLPEGDIFDAAINKKVGTAPAGWRLLVASLEDPKKRKLDAFSTAYELRAVHTSG